QHICFRPGEADIRKNVFRMHFSRNRAFGSAGNRSLHQGMLILAGVQPRHRTYQGSRSSVDVGIAVVGADYFSQHLVLIELNAKCLFNITDGSTGAYISVVWASSDHLEVVGLKEALDRLRFRSRGHKPGSKVFRLEPVPIVRRGTIIELLRKRIEFRAIVNIEPDADLDGLRWILGAKALRRGDKAWCIVGDHVTADRAGRQ